MFVDLNYHWFSSLNLRTILTLIIECQVTPEVTGTSELIFNNFVIFSTGLLTPEITRKFKLEKKRLVISNKVFVITDTG